MRSAHAGRAVLQSRVSDKADNYSSALASSRRADPDEAWISTVTCSEKNVHALRAPLSVMRSGTGWVHLKCWPVEEKVLVERLVRASASRVLEPRKPRLDHPAQVSDVSASRRAVSLRRSRQAL